MKKKYCCFCGTKLRFKPLSDGSKEKYCAQCDHVFFETPCPAVIVAVATNDRALVNERGLIAGYIRQGETAEEAAIRETREEVGLEISNLTFVNTYSAKKRNLLMIGYKAKAKDTHIKKSRELQKAVWCDLDKPLPLRPRSIAAQLARQSFPGARTSRVAKARFIAQI